jgi:hypothetical protein
MAKSCAGTRNFAVFVCEIESTGQAPPYHVSAGSYYTNPSNYTNASKDWLIGTASTVMVGADPPSTPFLFAAGTVVHAGVTEGRHDGTDAMTRRTSFDVSLVRRLAISPL